MDEDRPLTWQERLFRVRRPEPRGATELRHYLREADGVVTRFHLRTDPDGGGVLLANAANACRLSPTGVMMATGILEGKDNASLIAEICSRFHGCQAAEAAAHVAQLRELIDRLASPDDNYPISNFDDPGLSPAARRLGSPHRADLPAADVEQVFPLLRKLWDVGVMHVCFVAPPGVERERLVRLVERAEDLGMICGVRGRASDFGDDETVHALAQAGVDHLTYLFCQPAAAHDELLGEGDHAASREAMARALDQEVCPVAQVPLLTATTPQLEETCAELVEAGIRNVSFFAVAEPTDREPEVLSARELRPVAARVEEGATEQQVRFLWEVPVLRLPEAPLPRQVQRGPRAAGEVSLRVQPRGEVIPPRGKWESAGNLLEQSWQEIWNHPAFRVYREKVEEPSRCDECPGLALCGAACPTDPETWANDAGAEE